MEIQEIIEFRNEHWRPGWGSTSAPEMHYITSVLERLAPQNIAEIGVASGITSAIICMEMKRLGLQSTFYALDYSETFFGDKSKKVGYIMESIEKGDTDYKLLLKKTTLDLYDMAPSLALDFVFIDANHQHPWPTLDTIAVLPHMRTGAKSVIVHHDLRLFANSALGIGPKVLMDQFPESDKESGTREGNIGSILVTQPPAAYESHLADALLLPWNVKQRIPFTALVRFRRLIAEHYSATLLKAFDSAAERYY